MNMFAKATRKFVCEIDPEGCLIPVSRLNEKDNLTVLSLVIKRKPFWFWQKPKYIPMDFTLNDVLLGEDPICPDLIETDFLKYNHTIEGKVGGGAETDIGPGNLNIESEGSSKLASSFGSLKKQEVDVQKLLSDSKDRRLDFQHSLLKQALRRRGEVFALVKERIITTQSCTVTEKVQKEGNCSAFLGFTVPKKIQVSVKNGRIHCDSNASLEIPAQTALAYSILELTVKSTGQFELCLLPDTNGCFEVDGLHNRHTTLPCSTPPESPIQRLQEELDKIQVQFKVFSGLPASTRTCLYQQITLLLKSRAAISTLDAALEDLLCGKKSDLSTLDREPSLKKAVQTTLELLTEKEGPDHAPLDGADSKQQPEPNALTATNILTNALEEMTESTLSLLKSCCHRPTLQALHLLVHNVMENKQCSLKDSTLTPLAEEDTYNKVQELFGSSNVMLSKEEDLIQAQISSQYRNLPLILSIAIIGLASLACSTD